MWKTLVKLFYHIDQYLLLRAVSSRPNSSNNDMDIMYVPPCLRALLTANIWKSRFTYYLLRPS
jgi:hypothetical protein